MTVLSSSQATPVCTCPARRPRWCPLDSPYRLQNCCLPSIRQRRLSPALAGLSSRTTNIQFSGLSHAACTLATPGFTHTLLDMHAGSLQIRRLTFSGENRAVSYPYSLGNIIQFHKLLSDPMDLNLTRHDGCPVSDDDDRTFDLPVDELYRFSASYSWTGGRRLDYSLGGSLTVFGDTKIDNTVQGVRVKGDFDSNYLLFLGGTLRYVY